MGRQEIGAGFAMIVAAYAPGSDGGNMPADGVSVGSRAAEAGMQAWPGPIQPVVRGRREPPA